jgi:hypothetical protein
MIVRVGDQLTVSTGNFLILGYSVMLLAASVVAMVSAAWWQAVACAAIGGLVLATWTPRVTVSVDSGIATLEWSGLWKPKPRSFQLASLITVGAFQPRPGSMRPTRTSVEILTTEGKINIALVATEARAERIATEIDVFLSRHRAAG